MSELLSHVRWVLCDRRLDEQERADWRANGVAAWASATQPATLLAILTLTGLRRGSEIAAAIAESLVPAESAERFAEARRDPEAAAVLVEEMEAAVDANEDDYGPFDSLECLANVVQRLHELERPLGIATTAFERGFVERYMEERSIVARDLEYVSEQLVRAVATRERAEDFAAAFDAAAPVVAAMIRERAACPSVEELDASFVDEPPVDPLAAFVGTFQNSGDVSGFDIAAAWPACTNARWLLFALVYLGDRRRVVTASLEIARAVAPDSPLLDVATRWERGEATESDVRAALAGLDDGGAGRFARPLGVELARPVLLLDFDPDLDLAYWSELVVQHAVSAVFDDLVALRPTGDMLAWNAGIVLAHAAALEEGERDNEDEDEVEDEREVEVEREEDDGEFAAQEFEARVEAQLGVLAARIHAMIPVL